MGFRTKHLFIKMADTVNKNTQIDFKILASKLYYFS